MCWNIGATPQPTHYGSYIDIDNQEKGICLYQSEINRRVVLHGTLGLGWLYKVPMFLPAWPHYAMCGLNRSLRGRKQQKTGNYIQFAVAPSATRTVCRALQWAATRVSSAGNQ